MITKQKIIDRVEIVGEYKTIQFREATIFIENGVEISRTFHRTAVDSGSDITQCPLEVKEIADLVWTPAVKDALVAFKASRKDV